MPTSPPPSWWEWLEAHRGRRSVPGRAARVLDDLGDHEAWRADPDLMWAAYDRWAAKIDAETDQAPTTGPAVADVAARRLVRRTTCAQGVPPYVTDPEILKRVAGIIVRASWQATV